jgi:hypothetical protein
LHQSQKIIGSKVKHKQYTYFDHRANPYIRDVKNYQKTKTGTQKPGNRGPGSGFEKPKTEYLGSDTWFLSGYREPVKLYIFFILCFI